MSRNVKTISLPISRQQQYKFLFKTNTTLIFKLSLLLLVFCAPLIAQFFYILIGVGPILNKTGVNDIEKINNLFSFLRTMSLFLLISVPFLTIGVNGVTHVYKKFIYNDGFSLFRDFFKGIKEGSKSYFVTFIYTVLIVLGLTGLFSINIHENFTLFIVLLILFFILNLVLIIMYFFTIFLHQYYQLTFIQIIKNSFLLTFNKMHISFLIFLSYSPMIVTYLLDLLLFSRITFLSITSCFIYLVFLNTHNHFIFQLFAVSLFDKLINKTQYPDCYELGLYKENLENE